MSSKAIGTGLFSVTMQALGFEPLPFDAIDINEFDDDMVLDIALLDETDPPTSSSNLRLLNVGLGLNGGGVIVNLFSINAETVVGLLFGLRKLSRHLSTTLRPLESMVEWQVLGK